MNSANRLAGALILMLAWNPAQAILIDFDDIAPGIYDEIDFNALFSGVIFDNTTGDEFRVEAMVNDPFSDFSAPNVVINVGFAATDNATVARFDTPVDAVSVTMGDYGADIDEMYLNAYDAIDNLIGSDLYVDPLSPYSIHTLNVTAPLITYVAFFADGADGGNSVFWDNFSYTRVDIPEPPVAAMLAFALLVSLRARIPGRRGRYRFGAA